MEISSGAPSLPSVRHEDEANEKQLLSPRRISRIVPLCSSIQEDLRLFDAHARRELAKAMLNAMDRIIAAGYGKKPPPLYKVKIPRARKGRLVREEDLEMPRRRGCQTAISFSVPDDLRLMQLWSDDVLSESIFQKCTHP
jgi:hypothetical protein